MAQQEMRYEFNRLTLFAFGHTGSIRCQVFQHLYKTIASRQRTQDDSLSAERDKEDGTATDWYEHLRHSKRDGEESTESKSYELLRHSTREGEDSVESKSYELLRHSTRRQHYSTLSTHGYIDVIPT